MDASTTARSAPQAASPPPVPSLADLIVPPRQRVVSAESPQSASTPATQGSSRPITAAGTRSGASSQASSLEMEPLHIPPGTSPHSVAVMQYERKLRMEARARVIAKT